MNPERASNFSFLKAHDAQLVRLGLLAERYFADDPNTCLLKLRQLAELLAQLAASRVGIFTSSEEKQLDLLRFAGFAHSAIVMASSLVPVDSSGDPD